MPGYSSPNGAFAPNRYFFGEIKDVEFGPGHVESEVVRTSADRAVVRVLRDGIQLLRADSARRRRTCDSQITTSIFATVIWPRSLFEG